MAEQPQQPQMGTGEAQQQIEALVDEREMRTIYSNFFRMFPASEELILEFCFNMPNPNPAAAGKQQLLVKVADRVIMSYATAKRLSNALGQFVKRYEQQFGEVPLGQQRR
jgi:hypothetical protein